MDGSLKGAASKSLVCNCLSAIKAYWERNFTICYTILSVGSYVLLCCQMFSEQTVLQTEMQISVFKNTIAIQTLRQELLGETQFGTFNSVSLFI